VTEHDNLRAILEIVDADPNIDAVAVETRGPGGGGPPEQQMRMVNALKGLQERSSKPIVTIVHPGADEGSAAQGRQLFLDHGLASFHSFDRAARALASAIGYWRWRAGLE